MKKKLLLPIIPQLLLSTCLSVSAIASSSSDYFRSVASGNWKAASTWESSADEAGPYAPATIAPTYKSSGITIQAGYTVTLSDSRTIDQVTVNGTLVVNPNVYVILNDGPGTDLIISPAGKMILRSDATGSAGVDNLFSMATLANATIEQHNNVTQERYFQATRAWRLTTAPLRSSTSNISVFDTWQNGGVYEAGKGTLVTAPKGGANEGIDANAKNSLKTFNASSQSLQNINNTKTSPLITTANNAANKSYFVFIRGDRDTANLKPSNKNATTLSATGELQTGDQSFAVLDKLDEFTLVGNPYAALVDFGKVVKNNVYDRFYAFDPTIGEAGAYTVVDRPDGNTLYSAAVPASSQTQVIQLNQAILVQTSDASGGASVVFNEASKTTVANSTVIFRTSDNNPATFTSNLYGVYSPDSVKLFDGNRAVFSSDYLPQVDGKDIRKLENFGENFGLVRNEAVLAIEKRPFISNSDTLFLKLWNTTARDYRFQFNAANFPTSLSASLEDSYLKTSTPLSLNEPTTVSFNVTADPASASSNRFMVVFKPTAAPLIVNSSASINVYPNPVKGNNINVQLNNQPKGTYTVQIFGTSGQQIFNKVVEHPGGSFNHSLQLGVGVSKGVYQLQVVNGLTKITKQVIIN
jgi:hypothetical protein